MKIYCVMSVGNEDCDVYCAGVYSTEQEANAALDNHCSAVVADNFEEDVEDVASDEEIECFANERACFVIEEKELNGKLEPLFDFMDRTDSGIYPQR